MVLFISCLLSLIALPLSAYINQNNDVQLWTSAYYEQKLSDRIFLDLANEWRFGNDISELYFTYLQGILSLEPSAGVLVAPGYRQIWRRSATRPWQLAYEPLVDFILRREKRGSRLELRNRVSYLMREAGANTWRWRGRLLWMRLEGAIRPYVSNEAFIDPRRGFHQDRIIVGVLIPVISHLRGDVYYMLRYLKTETHWIHQHVIGLAFALNF